MENYIDRIVRAAKFDINLYEEIEADKGAMVAYSSINDKSLRP